MTPISPDFEIRTDPARKMMRIVLRGFWDEDTIARYDQALNKAGQEMTATGCALQDLLVFVDARALKTQARDLIASYQSRFGAADRQPRRIATITSNALQKLQAQRVAFANQRIFEDERQAMEWLLS